MKATIHTPTPVDATCCECGAHLTFRTETPRTGTITTCTQCCELLEFTALIGADGNRITRKPTQQRLDKLSPRAKRELEQNRRWLQEAQGKA